MLYKNVDLFYEPEEVCKIVTSGQSNSFSEMTSFQLAFLCGLLREKNPKKILEIGVAGGGSTAVVLTCLKILEKEAEMYSVDLAEKWYRTDKRETGFVAKEYMDQVLGSVQHKFLLGKSIPHVINKIGHGIDFLIMDTMHFLPGELLDFLICLPYLADGCVVVLHDVIQNHKTTGDNAIATKLLFDLVHGTKWYMDEKTDTFGYSNIAAFEVNEQTRENILNVFSGLNYTWTYLLRDDEMAKYVEQISSTYSTDLVDMFKRTISLQQYTHIKKAINSHYHMNHDFLRLKWEKQKNVFLYGAGYWAQIYSRYALINNLPISGWVISDDQDLVDTNEFSIPVCKLKDLTVSPENCSFILALDRNHFGQVKSALVDHGYYMIL